VHSSIISGTRITGCRIAQRVVQREKLSYSLA